MNNLTKATVISALWLLPFLGSFFFMPVSDGIQTAMVVTVVTALLGYVACIAGKGAPIEIRYTPLTILMMVLWGTVGVSVINSDAKFEALTYFFFFSALPLTFLFFTFVGTRVALTGIRFILLALGIFALIQFYFMPEMLKGGGVNWPLEDNNSLAILLASGSLLFLGEALKAARAQYYNIAAAIILFAALMTTGGAAVLFAFLLVLVVFIALIRPVTYKPVLAYVAAGILLMSVMHTSELSFYHFVESGTKTLEVAALKTVDAPDSLMAQPNVLSGSRLILWKSAYEIFKTHMFTGTGIGTFYLYYPEFRNPNDDSAGYAAHNDFVQLAVETGIWGPLAALAIIGFILFKTACLLRTFKTPEERIQFVLPFAVFGLIIGHSLVNFNMYVLPALMVMGILLAAWNAHLPMKSVTINAGKSVNEGVGFLAVMIVVLPLWGCTFSEYYTVRANDALAREDIQGFAANLNLADKWAAGNNGRATLQAAKFAAATNNTDRALVLLDKAEASNPRLIQIYVERAHILMATDTDKALAEAQKALSMDFGHVLARMMVFDVLVRMDKPDEAYDVLKAGMHGVMRARDPSEYYKKVAVESLNRMDLETNGEALSKLSKAQGLK